MEIRAFATSCGGPPGHARRAAGRLPRVRAPFLVAAMAVALPWGPAALSFGPAATPGAPSPSPGAPDLLAAAIARLRSPDPLEREAAEAQLAALDFAALPRLAEALPRQEDADARVRLEAAFRAVLAPLVEQWKGRFAAAARARAELALLERRARDGKGQGEKDRAARSAIEERLRAEQKAIARATERLRALGIAVYPSILPVAPCWRAPARAGAAALADGALARYRSDPDPGERFEAVRYFLSHVWRLAARGGSAADRARALLERHLERTLEDCLGPDRTDRVRARAAEELYLLGEEGVAFLRRKAAALEGGRAHDAARLLALLERRIPPSLAVRMGVDRPGDGAGTWRARRAEVYRLERLGRGAAIPALRVILQRDESPSVRLAAAEALARLRDDAGLRYLEERGLEELSKLPAVSRQVFVIQGIRLREAGDLEGSIRQFRKVLEEYPADFRANYEVAFSLLLSGRHQEAIQHFRRALDVLPKDVLTLYNLACAYALAGQADEALDALQAAVENGFDDADHIATDPDLAGIRDRERYKRILGKLREKQEEDAAGPDRDR